MTFHTLVASTDTTPPSRQHPDAGRRHRCRDGRDRSDGVGQRRRRQRAVQPRRRLPRGRRSDGAIHAVVEQHDGRRRRAHADGRSARRGQQPRHGVGRRPGAERAGRERAALPRLRRHRRLPDGCRCAGSELHDRRGGSPVDIEMWMRTDAMGKHQLLGKWGESSESGIPPADRRRDDSRRPARPEHQRDGNGVHDALPAGADRRLAPPGGDLRRPRRRDGGERHHDLRRWRGDAAGADQRSERTWRWKRRPRRSRSAAKVRSGTSTTARSTRFACGTWRARRARSRRRWPPS